MSDVDLLFSVPSSYQDNTVVIERLAPASETQLLCLVVTGRVMLRAGKPPRFSVQVQDTFGQVATATAFGNLNAWRATMVRHRKVYVRGKVSVWQGRLQVLLQDCVEESQVGGIFARYRGVEAADVRHSLNRRLGDAQSQWQHALSDLNESVLLQRAGVQSFRNLAEILVGLHDPISIQQAEAAKESVEKLAALEMMLQAKESSQRRFDAQSALNIDPHVVADLVCQMPFAPTGDQATAITEILKDLNSAQVMRRVLSGDVGTGKSVVIGVCAMAVAVSGKQAVVLVPNVPLAEQLASEFRAWWPGSKIAVISGGSRSEPLQIGTIYVGTTAMFRHLADLNVDFLVVDEQHKLSRQQREILMQQSTNLLESTATCVPRTQALLQYGHMAVSILRDCPVKNVRHTFHMGAESKDVLLGKVKMTLQQGAAVAVIYARCEGDEDDSYHVEQAFQLWSALLPGQVRLLHGKLKDAEKVSVIDDMKVGRARLLVASSVLEVGITIPDLRGLIIVNPERFGLSQMHQMRGRVARKGGEGWCCLYTPVPIEGASLKRVELMCSISDGFELADQDLELRGFGDLASESSKQTGSGVSKVWKDIRISPASVRCLAAWSESAKV